MVEEAEPALDTSASDEVEDDEEYWEGAPAVRGWWAVSAFALSILGLVDAVYLTYEHFTQGLPFCPENAVFNCAKVTTSKQSYLLHVPVALLGLLFFAAMVVVNFPPLWRTRLAWVAWARMGMATVGLGMVVYLISAEVFSIHAICLYCTGVHVITVLTFVLVLATFPTVLSASRAQGWEGGAEEDGT